MSLEETEAKYIQMLHQSVESFNIKGLTEDVKAKYRNYQFKIDVAERCIKELQEVRRELNRMTHRWSY